MTELKDAAALPAPSSDGVMANCIASMQTKLDAIRGRLRTSVGHLHHWQKENDKKNIAVEVARSIALCDGVETSEDIAELALTALRSRDARIAELEADQAEFMSRLGPRWFLEQNWFPASVKEPARASLTKEQTDANG